MSVHTFYPLKILIIVLPQKKMATIQPVSSERNHQVADKFRKIRYKRLNIHGRKRGLLTLHAWDYEMEK